jgi:hypothetical protein
MMKREEIKGVDLTIDDIDFITELGNKNKFDRHIVDRLEQCDCLKVDLWTSFRCRLPQSIEYDESNMVIVDNNWNMLPDYYIYYKQGLDNISGVLKYGEPTKVDYLFFHPNQTKYYEEEFDTWVLNTGGEMCCIRLKDLYDTKEEAEAYYINNVLSKYKKDMGKILSKEDEKIEASKKLLKVLNS